MRADRLHIVHITALYSGHGGVQNMVKESTEALRRRGHRVDVIVTAKPPSDGSPHEGIAYVSPTRRLLGRYPYSGEILRSVTRAAAMADVVHCHQPFAPGTLAAAIARGRIVVSPYWHPGGSARQRAQIRLLSRRMRKVVCISHAEARDLNVPKRTTVIAPGSNMTRRSRGSGSHLLAVSTAPNKRPKLVLDVARLLRDEFPLALCGRTSKDLQEAAALGGLEGGLLGPVSDEDLAGLYDGAAVFLAVSTDESFGLALFDAIASGVPVVASDIPAHREIFNMTGAAKERLVPVDAGPVEIASAVRAAAGSPPSGLYRSWDDVAADLESAYQAL
jgi:glycosyltransferase involved in cell wall biosynthesis